MSPTGRRSFDGDPLDMTMQHITERPALDEEAEDVVYATDPEPQGQESTEAVDVGSELYQGVVAAAGYQTGGPRTIFPAGVSRSTLVDSVQSGGEHRNEAIRHAIDAAVANDDLLEWEDRSGVTRYTPTERESLRHLVARENRRDEPRLELLRRCHEVHHGGEDDA